MKVSATLEMKRFSGSVVVAGMLVLASAHPSHAEPLVARIQIADSNLEAMVELHGVRNDMVSVREAGKNFLAQFPVSNIALIEFELTNPMFDGIRATQSGEWDRAMELLRGPAGSMLPYLAVRETNGYPVIEAFGQALVARGQIDSAKSLYSRLINAGDEQVATTARAWLGYLSAREKNPDEAKKHIARIENIEDNEKAFALKELSLGYLALDENDCRAASDHTAKVIALAGLEIRLYPEALFLAGRAYDGLAEKLQRELEQQRERQVEREFLSERVRVGRAMQEASRENKEKPPTENDILASIDRLEVESRVPKVPPIEENKYAQSAQKMYFLIGTLYPDSSWSRKAAGEIWESTRNQDIASKIEIQTENDPE